MRKAFTTFVDKGLGQDCMCTSLQLVQVLCLLTYKHSHDNINNDNADKTVDIENVVKSENATKKNVEVEELFEDNNKLGLSCAKLRSSCS